MTFKQSNATNESSRFLRVYTETLQERKHPCLRVKTGTQVSPPAKTAWSAVVPASKKDPHSDAGQNLKKTKKTKTINPNH